MNREWWYLFVAGGLEIAWLITLKYSQGFTRFWPTLLAFILAVCTSYLISLAIRILPAGTAYAIWTGMGVAGGAVAGMILFNESRDPLRLLCILIIIVGIVGLKLTHHE
jgi:quaternary ammonium compound-resistance protein SugE